MGLISFGRGGEGGNFNKKIVPGGGGGTKNLGEQIKRPRDILNFNFFILLLRDQSLLFVAVYYSRLVDATKGELQGLQGFQTLYTSHINTCHVVVLLLVTVPNVTLTLHMCQRQPLEGLSNGCTGALH